MKDRMATILGMVKANSQAAVETAKAEGGVRPGISNFAETGDDGFVLETVFSHWGHQTRLVYEVSAGGEFIWIRLTHLFGVIDMREGADVNKIFGLLCENSESAAYLAAAIIDELPYVSLNNHGSYLAKWSNEDIAQVLLDQLSRIIMGLLFSSPKLINELGIIVLKTK
jgi:hypothetical protein